MTAVFPYSVLCYFLFRFLINLWNFWKWASFLTHLEKRALMSGKNPRCFLIYPYGHKRREALQKTPQLFLHQQYCPWNYFGSSSKAWGLDYHGQPWKCRIPHKRPSHKWSYSKTRQEPVQDVHTVCQLMAQHRFLDEILALISLEPKLLVRLSVLHMCLIAWLGWGPAESAPGMWGKQWHFALSMGNLECY